MLANLQLGIEFQPGDEREADFLSLVTRCLYAETAAYLPVDGKRHRWAAWTYGSAG